MKQQTPQEHYDKSHTIKICLKLNLTHDADILAALEASGNKQGYIKSLIRADIAKLNSK